MEILLKLLPLIKDCKNENTDTIQRTALSDAWKIDEKSHRKQFGYNEKKIYLSECNKNGRTR